MDYYFEYLPNELNVEILYYIDTYEGFINLNEFDTFRVIFSTKAFWESLFRNSIGDLIEYITVNLRNLNIYYMALSYIKAITSYKECRNLLYQLINHINKRIQKYYPGKKMETIDVDLTEEEGTYNKLSNKGLYISIIDHNFQDLSFFFKDYTENVDLDPILGDYFLKNNTFSIKMHINFLRYYIIIYDTDFDIDVDTAPLTEKEFLGILFNIRYSGENIYNFYND